MMDEEWETVQGIGFRRYYIKKILFGTTHVERIKKCKLFCLKHDIALNESKTKSSTEKDFIQCIKWGFSYKYIGAGRIECRYPVAPWKHKKRTTCIAESRNVLVRHTIDIEECMQICLHEQRDCRQFSVVHLQKLSPSLNSPRQLTCHIYINNQKRVCNVKKRRFTLYYVKNTWINKALLKNKSKKTKSRVIFMFIKKQEKTAVLQRHLLSMLSTLTLNTKTSELKRARTKYLEKDDHEGPYSLDKIKKRNFHIAILVGLFSCFVFCLTCCILGILIYKLKKSILSIGDLTRQSLGKSTIQNLSTRNIVSSKTRTKRVLEI